MPDRKIGRGEAAYNADPSSFTKMGNGYVKMKKKMPTDKKIKVTLAEKRNMTTTTANDKSGATGQVRELLNYNPGSNLKGEAAKAKEKEFSKKVVSGNKAVEKNVAARNKDSNVRELVRATPKSDNKAVDNAIEDYKKNTSGRPKTKYAIKANTTEAIQENNKKKTLADIKAKPMTRGI